MSFISNNLRYPRIKLEPYAPFTARRARGGMVPNGTGISPKISLATEQATLILFSLPTSSTRVHQHKDPRGSNKKKGQASIDQIESPSVCGQLLLLPLHLHPLFFPPDSVGFDFCNQSKLCLPPREVQIAIPLRRRGPEKKPYPFQNTVPLLVPSAQQNILFSPTPAHKGTYNLFFKHFSFFGILVL